MRYVLVVQKQRQLLAEVVAVVREDVVLVPRELLREVPVDMVPDLLTELVGVAQRACLQWLAEGRRPGCDSKRLPPNQNSELRSGHSTTTPECQMPSKCCPKSSHDHRAATPS
eukprot:CAMPEP_0197915928 /NCGR_PEP_ID=MMETSP1439-20131203/81078_1 /TAXON_ID=66791 /ORGANISM="Gonyaulax spinifera, Strain CCMP409" /LENGTH=112 /DNA_ID=CAMNT_0043537911 /DNA_START=4 /DNA_END=340 /DNA_ORIENTATION=+